MKLLALNSSNKSSRENSNSEKPKEEEVNPFFYNVPQLSVVRIYIKKICKRNWPKFIKYKQAFFFSSKWLWGQFINDISTLLRVFKPHSPAYLEVSPFGWWMGDVIYEQSPGYFFYHYIVFETTVYISLHYTIHIIIYHNYSLYNIIFFSMKKKIVE